MFVSVLFPDLFALLMKVFNIGIPAVSQKSFDFYKTATRAAFDDRRKENSVRILFLNARKYYVSTSECNIFIHQRFQFRPSFKHYVALCILCFTRI